MRKFLAVLLSVTLLATLAVLPAVAESAITMDNIKIGFVHVSDPSDMGYTYNHDLGTQKMKTELGLRDDQWRLSFQSRFGRARWLEPSTASR